LKKFKSGWGKGNIHQGGVSGDGEDSKLKDWKMVLKFLKGEKRGLALLPLFSTHYLHP